MKSKLINLLYKLSTWAAMGTLLIALGNTGRNCWFLIHQPDLPEELKR